MAYTARYGLQAFGGRVPGTFRDDGYAYTLADRHTIDALLAALETHDHSGGTRLEDPAMPTAVVVVDPAGKLPGGRSYYYRVGYLDRFGLETAASPEVSVTIPPGPPTPGGPSLVAGTGGALGNGGYYYAIAAYVGDTTRQTLASTTAFMNLTGSFTKITLTFPDPDPAADGWVIYRRGPQETMLYCLTSVPKSTLTFDDTGSLISDCTKTPALSDTTASTNKVLVTISATDTEPVPATISTETQTGGTLAAGTYSYTVRPKIVSGASTKYGAPASATATVLASGKVKITAGYRGGAFTGGGTPPVVSMELYGRTGSLGLLSTTAIPLDATEVVIYDTGSGSPGAAMSSTQNWVGLDPDIAAWKLYRTSRSGEYSSTSLVHHVTEGEAIDSGGNLISSWYDMGDVLLAGTPRNVSATFQPPSNLTLITRAETTVYDPAPGSIVPGPYVSDALDSLTALLARWTQTYTIYGSTTGPLTGAARLYPNKAFYIKSVRAALSTAATLTYQVNVDGSPLWGSAQSVTAAGQTVAATPPSILYPSTSYITVDLASGNVPSGAALVIHLDLSTT